jgi:hypothetical protein
MIAACRQVLATGDENQKQALVWACLSLHVKEPISLAKTSSVQGLCELSKRVSQRRKGIFDEEDSRIKISDGEHSVAGRTGAADKWKRRGGSMGNTKKSGPDEGGWVEGRYENLRWYAMAQWKE